MAKAKKTKPIVEEKPSVLNEQSHTFLRNYLNNA